MKLAETLLSVCVLALAGFIGAQSLDAREETRSEAAGAIEVAQSPHAVAPTGVVRHGEASKGDLQNRAESAAATVSLSSGADTAVASLTRHEASRPVDPAGGFSGTSASPSPRFLAEASTVREMRRRIAAGGSGTYIDELLVARDSALSRWPNRQTRPLRVWVDDASDVEGWNEEFVTSVREAFDTWAATGIPLRFDYITDSASADVHVRFTDRLANGISGKTVWSRDSRWWLVDGDIELALVHPSGGSVSPTQMRAIALHEVGHLLGLDHASSAENIMAARVRVRELSESDRATVRLLYSMPPGSIK